MNAPDSGEPLWAGDVELDLLLLHAKAGALDVLDTTLDMAAGLAAIRAQPERGTGCRPRPARAGPGGQRQAGHHDQRDRHDDLFNGTEGHLS